MVRIRLGSTWKQDPDFRTTLSRGGAAAAEAARSAIDALALELDGVDVASGRAEGALLPSLEELGEAILRLLAGARRAEVHFSEGGIELLLARVGPSALLTVVSLSRPARVTAQGLEVDLLELAHAVREALLVLADDLATLEGGRAPSRSLRQVASRLGTANAAPSAEHPGPGPGMLHAQRPRADAPICAFDLRDEGGLIGSYRGPGPDLGSLLTGGEVVLRTPDGRELLSIGGPPFLVLRDLAAFAGMLADAAKSGEQRASVALALPGRHATSRLEVDLLAGTVSTNSAPPRFCPVLPLARALLEAAVDYCGVVAARNPWQAENGWLAELRLGAGERLAHVQELLGGDVYAADGVRVRERREKILPRAPLGPGRIRRLVFRRAFEAEAGAPAGFGLALEGRLLIAAGASAVLGLDARSGRTAWRSAGVTQAALHGGCLLICDGARLRALGAADGRELWARELDGLPEAPRTLRRLSGGLLLLLGGQTVAALEAASGRTIWTFRPPAARELWAASVGQVAVVGSDAGFLYGILAASGHTAWRLRVPGHLVASPGASGGDGLALCATEFGGSLIVFDPVSGKRRHEVPLDVAPTAGPLPFAGLWAVAGAVAGDPVVVAVNRSGQLAFEAAPSLGVEPVALTALKCGLIVKTSRGACVALGRAGQSLWARPPRALHPPPANVPAVVARGVALVAGEHLEALDASTGELLGEVPLAAPVRLASDPGLHLYGMDAAGVVTCERLETHLSVL